MYAYACRAISDSARSQNVLSSLFGECAVDQDSLLGSRAPQSIRKCHESHVREVGAILILDDSDPKPPRG